MRRHALAWNLPGRAAALQAHRNPAHYGDNNSNKGSSDEILFGQAFGYFEARVKFPDTDGLWSAFWLQSSNQRKVASEGVDGTEIDIFESAFRRSKTSKMGHALLWNGYGAFPRWMTASWSWSRISTTATIPSP